MRKAEKMGWDPTATFSLTWYNLHLGWQQTYSVTDAWSFDWWLPQRRKYFVLGCCCLTGGKMKERKKTKQNTHTKQNKNQQLQQEQQHGLLMKTHKVAFHITCWICATCIWRLIGFVMYTFKQTFIPAIISDANSHNHAICQIIGKLANLWNWFWFQLWTTLYKRRNRHPSPPKTTTTTKKRRNLDWHASPPPPHTHTHSIILF